MFLALATVFFLLIYAGLIFYYYWHWKQLAVFVPQKRYPRTKVSVLIAARNEAQTLPHLLKTLAGQTYPPHLFEVIVVDDFSTDDTWNVVKPFVTDRIKLIRPNADAARSSKKKAIETGIKNAGGELMIITDADCLPAAQWIETIAAFYEQKGAVFIAAPVRFTHNHSLLQIFQALDFITLQGITAASVQAQFHTMCNGANLSYTKEAFLKVDGFAGIDKVASGDDMLLMHKIWKGDKSRVHYLKSDAAIVSTEPMKTWKDFFNQRKRWASKTAYYDDKRVFVVLLFIYVFNCFFIALIVASFFHTAYWLLVALYLVVKTSVEAVFVSSVAAFYKEKKLLPYFPFLQPLHILYTISTGFISQWGRYEWKGRKTK